MKSCPQCKRDPIWGNYCAYVELEMLDPEDYKKAKFEHCELYKLDSQISHLKETGESFEKTD